MLRLADGRTLWVQPAATAPIAIANRLVLVRTSHRIESVLPLALLDARDGSLKSSAVVVLPQGVDTSHDFGLHATGSANGFVLHWSQCRGYSGGAHPSAEVLQHLRAGEVDAGVIHFDLSGSVLQEPATEEIAPPVESRSVRIGDAIYTLTDEMAIESHDAASGTLRWRRELTLPSFQAAPPLPM